MDLNINIEYELTLKELFSKKNSTDRQEKINESSKRSRKKRGEYIEIMENHIKNFHNLLQDDDKYEDMIHNFYKDIREINYKKQKTKK